jgi:hypothetical protein
MCVLKGVARHDLCTFEYLLEPVGCELLGSMKGH